MIRSKLIGILALAFLFPMQSAMAREGAYFAFSLGQSKTNTNGANFSSIGYGALLGAQINHNMAVEIEYINHGVLSDEQNENIATTSKVISLIFLKPLNPRISLYAKIGAAEVNSIISSSTIAGVSNTLATIPYGLGFQYEFSHTTTLRLFAETGYDYQANGTTGTVAATNYSFNGSIYRLGLTSLYAF
jgi:hypothetical protein